MADEGLNLQKYLHGYARVIYYDGDEYTGTAQFPWFIWEGGVSGFYSRPTHYGRFINSWSELAVGWWCPKNEMSLEGQGIVY